MKNNKTLLAIASVMTLLIISTMLVMADCYDIIPGSHCGGFTQTAKCSNNCVFISWNINGPEETCESLGEDSDDCGYTSCNNNLVGEVEYKDTETKAMLNGVCLGCGLPDSVELGYGRWCHQDSIPTDAVECVDCF